MPARFTFSNLLHEVGKSAPLATRKKGPFMMLFAKEESDIDLWLKQIEEARALADSVLPSIEGQIKQCKDRLQQYSQEQIRILENKNGIIRFQSDSESIHDRYLAQISALNVRYQDVQEHIQHIYSSLSARQEEINKKHSMLRKWAWVPFYNLQLYCDFKSEIDQYERELNTQRAIERSIREERDKIEEELQKSERGERSITRLIMLMEDNLKEITQRIDLLNRLMFQWNSFYKFFLYLKSDLSSKDDVAALIEDAKTEIERANEAEKSIPYDLFYASSTIETGRYQILTRDKRMVVSNGLHEPLSFQSQARPDAACDLLVFNLANGSSMILDKDFYVLSMSPDYREMVMTYFEDSENQCFEINGTEQEAVIFPKGKKEAFLGTFIFSGTA